MAENVVDLRQEAIAQDPLHAEWVDVIAAYEAQTKRWCDKSDKIIRRYKANFEDDNPSNNTDNVSKFNVLWSNIETLKPALYATTPKAQVERRGKTTDRLTKAACEVLERSIQYFLSTAGFGSMMRQSVLDYLLPGRGVCWVRYVPHFVDSGLAPTTEEQAQEGVQLTDDSVKAADAPEAIMDVAFEEAVPDYVHWKDFGHTPARTWEEVTGVWRRVYMSRRQLIARFGPDLGSKVPLDQTQRDSNQKPTNLRKNLACIYEIWDRDTMKAIWLSKSYPVCLDVRDDPLKIEKFFPCPRPLFTTLANDSLIPVPDYIEYQDQAIELDELTARLAAVIKAVKVAGCYDATTPAISRVFAEGQENALVPVNDWANFQAKGGLTGAMALIDIEPYAKALQVMQASRTQIKNDLYEITGMADIIRGATNPNETATAQGIKARFVTMRLDERQREVQRYARNIVEIIGQVIATHFELATLREISGVSLLTAEQKAMASTLMQAQQKAQQDPQAAQAIVAQIPQLLPQLQQMQAQLPDDWQELMDEPTWEEVVGFLRNQPLRSFRMDIETDSTLASDEQADKQQTVEFVTAVSQYLEQALQVGQAAPDLVPLLGQILMFAVRSFKVSRPLESAFEDAVKAMEEQASAPDDKPDPVTMKLQSDQQIAQAKIAADQQTAAAKAQLDAQADMFRAKLEQQTELMKEQLVKNREMTELGFNGQVEKMRDEMNATLELILQHLKNASAIEVARINAGADLGAAMLAQEQAAAGQEPTQ